MSIVASQFWLSADVYLLCIYCCSKILGYFKETQNSIAPDNEAYRLQTVPIQDNLGKLKYLILGVCILLRVWDQLSNPSY
jgi:hypothetical protein